MNSRDFDGNLHGPYCVKNPDGSIRKQGHYVHGVFYTGNVYQKKHDPVRHAVLRALASLQSLPLDSAQARGRYKHAKQSLALLYKAVQQNKR